MPSGAAEQQGFKGGTNLIWRVRIVALNDREIHVEQPTAMGSLIDLARGLTLVAVMSIGQNRWMFHTRSLGTIGGERGPRMLRLEMPENVERVQRRNFYRISTAEIALPVVECWPLLDPASVAVAEVANRALIQELNQSEITGRVGGPTPDDSLVLPEVGPKFAARLVNLGGGGAGLLIRREDSGALERARLFWLRIDLTPNIPAPIAMTARLAHTRFDSEQNIHAGLAFDFSFHPSHKSFVVDQIARYVGLLQRRQMADAARKSA